MRLLARHQWVREHGVPRISVLAGSVRTGAELWRDWLELAGRTIEDALTIDVASEATRSARREQVNHFLDVVVIDPRRPAALLCRDRRSVLDGAAERIVAMVDEGWIDVSVPAKRRTPTRKARALATSAAESSHALRARSLAELTLFEALEATPATAGRFQLNQRVTVRFGPGDAEVDLLSAEDGVAIEIDGYHHFADADHYRRDRRKDLLLQSRGYLVVRVLAEDVHHDPRAAVRMVCEALAHRTRRGRLPRS